MVPFSEVVLQGINIKIKIGCQRSSQVLRDSKGVLTKLLIENKSRGDGGGVLSAIFILSNFGLPCRKCLSECSTERLGSRLSQLPCLPFLLIVNQVSLVWESPSIPPETSMGTGEGIRKILRDLLQTKSICHVG